MNDIPPGLHVRPFVTNTLRLTADDEPKTDKTWLVMSVYEERLCGSLQSAQMIAATEAKRHPGCRIVIYEAVEIYKAPIAETERVKLDPEI